MMMIHVWDSRTVSSATTGETTNMWRCIRHTANENVRFLSQLLLRRMSASCCAVTRIIACLVNHMSRILLLLRRMPGTYRHGIYDTFIANVHFCFVFLLFFIDMPDCRSWHFCMQREGGAKKVRD